MSRVLNTRERQMLQRLQVDHETFHIRAKLGPGVGNETIVGLLNLGLVEAGPNPRHYGEVGWRLTPNGWRCMFGMTLSEISQSPVKPVRELPIWRWPPELP